MGAADKDPGFGIPFLDRPGDLCGILHGGCCTGQAQISRPLSKNFLNRSRERPSQRGAFHDFDPIPGITENRSEAQKAQGRKISDKRTQVVFIRRPERIGRINENDGGHIMGGHAAHAPGDEKPAKNGNPGVPTSERCLDKKISRVKNLYQGIFKIYGVGRGVRFLIEFSRGIEFGSLEERRSSLPIP